MAHPIDAASGYCAVKRSLIGLCRMLLTCFCPFSEASVGLSGPACLQQSCHEVTFPLLGLVCASPYVC